jgi:hypothetical protein
MRDRFILPSEWHLTGKKRLKWRIRWVRWSSDRPANYLSELHFLGEKKEVAFSGQHGACENPFY